ncbi:MAG: MerR family DNA-binding transcriptional regulator [Thermomicrobiales bacterium]
MATELLTIGQLAKRAGVRPSTLRFYEAEGLLTPSGRSESGYRLYGPEDEQALLFIQRTHRLGFALADVGTLLTSWRKGDASAAGVIETAERRFMALERQVTQLLVAQHELGLFLRDLRERAGGATPSFDQLLDRVCADPLSQPPEETLTWLLRAIGCRLQSPEGRALLDQLRGQHIHLWQAGDEYHILVVSDDRAVGAALEALANLEADCLAHAHEDQAPELAHNEEGFLLVARGPHAFLFARLFLALEQEAA